MGTRGLQVRNLRLFITVAWVAPATRLKYGALTMTINKLKLKIVDQCLNNLIDIVISELVSRHDSCLFDKNMKLFN